MASSATRTTNVSRPNIARPAQPRGTRDTRGAGPHQRTALRSISTCAAGSAALSRLVPSGPRLTSGTTSQGAPARHVCASPPAEIVDADHCPSRTEELASASPHREVCSRNDARSADPGQRTGFVPVPLPPRVSGSGGDGSSRGRDPRDCRAVQPGRIPLSAPCAERRRGACLPCRAREARGAHRPREAGAQEPDQPRSRRSGSPLSTSSFQIHSAPSTMVPRFGAMVYASSIPARSNA